MNTKTLILLLLTATGAFADGYEAYKRDFMLKQLPQVMSGKMPEEERSIRIATIDYRCYRAYSQLTDERKFYWEWQDRYGLNATDSDKEKLRRYIDTHFSLGRRTSNQTYEDFVFGS